MLTWVSQWWHVGTLFFLPWLVYWDILKGSWVSDDCAFSGPEAKPISIYDGVQQQPISWHTLFKRLRYFYGRKPNPDRDWKAKKLPPYVPSAIAHHRFNLFLFSGLLVLLYAFLGRLFTPSLAFLTCLLFLAHPIGVQTIGWISGIGYPLGTFFMLLGLNWILLTQDGPWMRSPMGVLLTVMGYTFFQWMAVEAWFVTVGVVAILLWLQAYPFAFIAACFAFYQCFHTFKEAIALRRKTFTEQQMGQSTKLYPRKLLIVLKTLAYNVKLVFFPKRLGLYHTFCYHYELPYVEHEDGDAVVGFLVTLLLGVGIWKGTPPVSFGCLWFLSFLVLFLNWITANQFVVDRYVWLPSLGACLVVAATLPAPAVWILFGIALMRLWTQIPAYFDETNFYVSNLLNFPKSEVAMGNLGVTYLNQNLPELAMGVWTQATQINPEYDVPWYNLSSLFRVRGPLNPNYAPGLYIKMPNDILERCLVKDPVRSHLHVARYCLDRALKAKSCHFPKVWQQELIKLDQELAQPVGMPITQVPLIQPLLTAAVT